MASGVLRVWLERKGLRTHVLRYLWVRGNPDTELPQGKPSQV